ncbi:PadR family transcriptional regulator [Gordonia neofelifaecis]|uniref:Transcriptional regulator n=1 Tax=Gordonia neofelifaecis NRRL B-59395 TaxID=644548 RepID=F1YKD1_9ACTN|nr:PadR family transcriptional regulator [Gordonia neofelifaecis]EGD54817.1 transcriptional regulator [Gordonia neofelifaecis NRRL B-59395]
MSTKQPRLTPLGVMVLALLREGDMHPYEMVRLLKTRRDDRMVSVTNGTLYHTVDRLNQHELVAEVGVDRDGNRPERTTYTLTDAGRDAVVDWVRAELPQNDRPAQFRVALAEAHNLEREETIELLSRRRDALAADLEGHRNGLRDAAGRGVQDQFMVEVDRQADLIEVDLRWTERLLQRLADPAYLWGMEAALAAKHPRRSETKDSK